MVYINKCVVEKSVMNNKTKSNCLVKQIMDWWSNERFRVQSWLCKVKLVKLLFSNWWPHSGPLRQKLHKRWMMRKPKSNGQWSSNNCLQTAKPKPRRSLNYFPRSTHSSMVILPLPPLLGVPRGIFQMVLKKVKPAVAASRNAEMPTNLIAVMKWMANCLASVKWLWLDCSGCGGVWVLLIELSKQGFNILTHIIDRSSQKIKNVGNWFNLQFCFVYQLLPVV